MGQYLAALAIAGSMGCSLIYNPDHITHGDAEVITDVNPSLLMLSGVAPAQIYEGEGDDGGRPCVLAIRGTQIQDATVSIAPTTANPKVMLVLGQQMVSPDHDWIAVEVTAKVMTDVPAGTDIPLTVTVTQPGAPMPQTLPWALTPLDELPAGDVDTGTLKDRYARVDVGDVTFSGSKRAVIVAMGKIKMGALTAKGNGGTPGPGGLGGGPAGSKGSGYGGGGGASGGGAGGGGAGFSGPGHDGLGTGVGTAGNASGDPLVPTYDGHPPGTQSANAASGGGGGGGGIGAGGSGGAGGGTIELTAGASVDVGAINVDGGTGSNGGGLSVAAGGGGGGAGGVIVLRAGTTVKADSISAKGGGGGTGNSLGGKDGGAGADGRIRIDTPMAPTITTSSTPAQHRGIVFVSPPTFTTMQRPALAIAGTANDGYSIVHHDQDNNTVSDDGAASRTIGGNGMDTFTPTLRPGINELCVLVAGGVYGDAEARNCIHVAFLPGAP